MAPTEIRKNLQGQNILEINSRASNLSYKAFEYIIRLDIWLGVEIGSLKPKFKPISLST